LKKLLEKNYLSCFSKNIFAQGEHRHLTKWTDECLVVNVSSICGRHKILAVKASALFNPAQLPCWPARLACARCYRSCFVEVDFVQTDMLEQSIFLRYL
jgi:hypothetical protein